MATGNDGVAGRGLSLVDFCSQVRVEEKKNPKDDLCLSHGRVVSKTSFEEDAASRLGTVDYLKYKGYMSVNLKDSEGRTFEQCQQALLERIGNYNLSTRIGDRLIDPLNIQGLTPASLKPLVRQYEKSPFVAFKPQARPYTNRADNAVISSAPPLREGDYKHLMQFLEEKMERTPPRFFQNDETRRDLFHQLCSVELNDTVQLAQLISSPYRDSDDVTNRFESLKKKLTGKPQFAQPESPVIKLETGPIEGIGKLLTATSVDGRPLTYFHEGMPLPKEIKSQHNLQALDYEIEFEPTDVKRTLEANNKAARESAFAEGEVSTNEKYQAFEKLLTGETPMTACAYGFELETTSKEIPHTGIAMTDGNCRYFMQNVPMASRRYCEVAGQWAPVTFVGVLDGHCKEKTSENPKGDDNSAATNLAENLPHAVKVRLELFNEKALTEAGVVAGLQTGVVDLDRHHYYGQGGATVNAAVVIGNSLSIANVGDSRALYINPHAALSSNPNPDEKDVANGFMQLSEDAKVLPEDQNPENAESRFNKMVHERGGVVVPDKRKPDILRVQQSEDKEGISTACALGDHDHNGIISPRPVVTQFPLDQFDDRGYLVQFCDGISEVATSEQVARLVRQEALANPGIPPQQLAVKVRDYAFKADSKDHLTVVVTPVSSLKQ